MSGICNAVMPAGAVECLKKAGAAQYLVIDDLSVSFANGADFINEDTNKAFINESLKSYVFKLADYEPGTADATQATLASTRNIVIDKPIPNMIAYADLSFCDQQALVKTLRGGAYRVRIATIDNEVLGYKLTNGTIKGYKAEITAITGGIPLKTDIDKLVKIMVNFVSYEEFENSVIAVPPYSFGLALVEVTPAGLTMSIDGEYAAGDVNVQVNARCGPPELGLVTADFEVVSSNVISPTIVAVEVGLGVYTLTIQKDGPVDLAAGDNVIFRVKKGSPVGFVSGNVSLTV